MMNIRRSFPAVSASLLSRTLKFSSSRSGRSRRNCSSSSISGSAITSDINKPIVINLEQYILKIKDSLKPPVSNKIIFNGSQLKLMIVGGPNQRDDFHIEDGEELFIQLIGCMELHVMNKNKSRQNIPISEMEMFLLPKHIPHSPQRFSNTIGIVIERTRLPYEKDCLRWYYPNNTISIDSNLSSTSSSSSSLEIDKQGEILYEETFYCEDLGTQLKPVIERFFATAEYKTYIQNKRSYIAPMDYNTLAEVIPSSFSSSSLMPSSLSSIPTSTSSSHSSSSSSEKEEKDITHQNTIRPPFPLMNEIDKLYLTEHQVQSSPISSSSSSSSPIPSSSSSLPSSSHSSSSLLPSSSSSSSLSNLRIINMLKSEFQVDVITCMNDASANMNMNTTNNNYNSSSSNNSNNNSYSSISNSKNHSNGTTTNTTITSNTNTHTSSVTTTIPTSIPLPRSSDGDIILWQCKHSSSIQLVIYHTKDNGNNNNDDDGDDDSSVVDDDKTFFASSKNRNLQQPYTSGIQNQKHNIVNELILNEGEICILPASLMNSFTTQPHVTQYTAGASLLIITNKIFQKK